MLHCPKPQEPTTFVRLGITDFQNWSAMPILHSTPWSLRYRRMRVWPARPYSRRLAGNHPRNGLDEQLFKFRSDSRSSGNTAQMALEQLRSPCLVWDTTFIYRLAIIHRCLTFSDAYK